MSQFTYFNNVVFECVRINFPEKNGLQKQITYFFKIKPNIFSTQIVISHDLFRLEIHVFGLVAAVGIDGNG